MRTSINAFLPAAKCFLITRLSHFGGWTKSLRRKLFRLLKKHFRLANCKGLDISELCNLMPTPFARVNTWTSVGPFGGITRAGRYRSREPFANNCVHRIKYEMGIFMFAAGAIRELPPYRFGT
jgi:hypothetical protein